MSAPKILSEEELTIGRQTWRPEDHAPGSLQYLCAVALENLDRTRKFMAMMVECYKHKGCELCPLDDTCDSGMTPNEMVVAFLAGTLAD